MSEVRCEVRVTRNGIGFAVWELMVSDCLDCIGELMVRWYQFGCFSPIFRTHGCRNCAEPEVRVRVRAYSLTLITNYQEFILTIPLISTLPSVTQDKKHVPCLITEISRFYLSLVLVLFTQGGVLVGGVGSETSVSQF